VLARTGGEPVERLEPLPAEEEAALDARIDRLERRREQLGAVNPLAREEYEEAQERHRETAEQIADLEASVRELRRLIRDLTGTITEQFDRTYTDVERHFSDTIGTLFPGGRGRLRLVEPEAVAVEDDSAAPPDPAEPGVELEISPAGKQISRLQMLSGGEKALGAIAFLFAIMLARPCPFYVLDEVDAALDDINVDRFLQLVERYRDRAQFIVITHQKRTMEAADVLYGVTMAQDGISKVVSRRLPAARREAPDLVTT
jgi:chromosome segregation protein